MVSVLLMFKCTNNESETNITHFSTAIIFMINDPHPLNTVGHLYNGPLTSVRSVGFTTLQYKFYISYVY